MSSEELGYSLFRRLVMIVLLSGSVVFLSVSALVLSPLWSKHIIRTVHGARW